MTDETLTQESEVTEIAVDLNINDVFDDSDEPEQETVTETNDEKGEPEEAKAEPEAETESATVETPATKETGLQAALTAERHKRQEAEKQLKELQTKSTIPDPINDPEGYATYLRDQGSQESLNTRIALSRDLMIDAKPDYLEKESVFMGLIMKDGQVVDDSLHKRFLASPNPARFAYTHANEHLEVQKLKDPSYLETIKKEAYEQGLKDAKAKKKSATELPDLTNATASGSNSVEAEKSYSSPKDVLADAPL